jgi:hypothetical protein
MQDVFKGGRAGLWTPERISRLSSQEIKQLRENAERLNEVQLAALCGEALKAAPTARGRKRSGSGPRTKARKLVARTSAFQGRGVTLQDPKTSWGGVRKTDGAVVVALWADAISNKAGECTYLLWAPNVDGSRPWSDTAAGRERLDHCRRAIELGRAEGLLVYGEEAAGHLPEHKAHTVLGADAETVLLFEVEQRGDQYFAVWGRTPATAA